jgi:type II secretory pathway pseudopilin PulG
MWLAIFLKSKQGLTFVELMVVAMILAVTITALTIIFINALTQINLAKEISIATDDLADCLEKMRTVSFANLVAQFPEATAINPALIGGFALLNETIVVRYPQGTSADPLEVSVTVTWTSKDGRTRSQVFRTLRTRML